MYLAHWNNRCSLLFPWITGFKTNWCEWRFIWKIVAHSEERTHHSAGVLQPKQWCYRVQILPSQRIFGWVPTPAAESTWASQQTSFVLACHQVTHRITLISDSWYDLPLGRLLFQVLDLDLLSQREICFYNQYKTRMCTHSNIYRHTVHSSVPTVIARQFVQGCDGTRTKLVLKRAPLHFKVLYLRPDGSNVKCWLRGWSVSFAIVSARRVMTLWLISERLGVGRQMISEAACLFLLEVVDMVKTQGKQYIRMGWIMLLYSNNERWGQLTVFWIYKSVH